MRTRLIIGDQKSYSVIVETRNTQPQAGETEMTTAVERMKRELWSDLMALIESGEMTDVEAMEWYNAKCDKWDSQ